MDNYSRIRNTLASRFKVQVLSQRMGACLSDGELHDWADEVVSKAIASAVQSGDWDPTKGSFLRWCSLKVCHGLREDLRRQPRFLKLIELVAGQVRLSGELSDELTRYRIRRELTNQLGGMMTLEQRVALTAYFMLETSVGDFRSAPTTKLRLLTGRKIRRSWMAQWLKKLIRQSELE